MSFDHWNQPHEILQKQFNVAGSATDQTSFLHNKDDNVCTFSWGLREPAAAPGLDWRQRRVNPPWNAGWPPSALWRNGPGCRCPGRGDLDPECLLRRPMLCPCHQHRCQHSVGSLSSISISELYCWPEIGPVWLHLDPNAQLVNNGRNCF